MEQKPTLDYEPQKQHSGSQFLRLRVGPTTLAFGASLAGFFVIRQLDVKGRMLDGEVIWIAVQIVLGLLLLAGSVWVYVRAWIPKRRANNPWPVLLMVVALFLLLSAVILLLLQRRRWA